MVGIIKTADHINQSRFSGAARTNDSNHFPWLDSERHVFQNGEIRIVAKTDMVKLDPAFNRGAQYGMGCFQNHGSLIQKLESALCDGCKSVPGLTELRQR